MLLRSMALPTTSVTAPERLYTGPVPVPPACAHSTGDFQAGDVRLVSIGVHEDAVLAVA